MKIPRRIGHKICTPSLGTMRRPAIMLTGFCLLMTIACGGETTPPWEATGSWQRGQAEEEHMAKFLEQRGMKLKHNKFVTLYPTADTPSRDVYIMISCLDEYSELRMIATKDILAGIEVDFQFNLLRADQSILHSDLSETGRTNITNGIYSIVFEDKDKITQILDVFKRANAREDVEYVKLNIKRERTLESVFNPTGIEDAAEYLGCFD